MRRISFVTAAAILSACATTASQPVKTSPATSTAQTTVTAPVEPLLAIWRRGSGSVDPTATVSIIGFDGRPRATVDFQPMSELGCIEAGYVIRPAQVADGTIFYLSRDGVVTSLRASGPATAVTQLPRLARDQAIWFAVKPDGTRLMATVATYPARTPGQELPPVCSGPSSVKIVSAVFPQATSVVRNEPSPSDRSLPAVVGWDNKGPLATIDTQMAHLGTPEGSQWFGHAAYLDSHGQRGARLGGADCEATYGDLPDGRLICYQPAQPVVRDAAGHLIWQLRPVTEGYYYSNVRLSPDASRVAFTIYKPGFDYDSTVVRSQQGIRTPLPTLFIPEGWLDNDTIVGQESSGLAIIHMSTPNRVESLHTTGEFLGVIRH